MPRGVQWSRFEGQPLPPNTRLVTRPGRYGNPWQIGIDGDRDQVVDRFEAFLADRSREPGVRYPSDEEIRQDLAGKDLACSCPLGARCHRDVLIGVANAAPVGGLR